jgi:DNA repair exonuclease SbcCD nuclease subunit
MPIFLHAADIHLDSPLRKLPAYEGAPVEAVRSATRRALGNLVDYAVAEGVPLLLLAGDVYDGDWQDFQTGLHFAARMRDLRDAGVRVVLVRGNHDAQSAMTRSLTLPDNVTVLPSGAAGSVVFEDLGIAVHGRSYAVRDETENFVPGYPPPVPGLFNIGLLHTAVAGSQGHAPYAPCRLADLLAKGYDYWALGHVHEHAVLHAAPPVVYAGALQGRGVRETGPRGCVRVDVETAGAARVRHVPLDVMRWAVLDLDVSGAAGLPEACRALDAPLGAALDASGGLPLAVRLTLAGRCPAHAALAADPEALAAELRARAGDLSSGRAWVEKVVLHTAPSGEAGSGASGPASDTPLGALDRALTLLADDAAAFAALGADFTELAAKLRAVPGTDVDLPDLPGPNDPNGPDDPGDRATRRALLEDVRGLLASLAAAAGEDAP